MISEGWFSADSSDIVDLEEVLDHSFSVFDQITYSDSGLNIRALGDGRYEVRYSSKIVGEISGQGIRHSEEEALVEIVGIKEGQLLILETQSGQSWK